MKARHCDDNARVRLGEKEPERNSDQDKAETYEKLSDLGKPIRSQPLQ